MSRQSQYFENFKTQLQHKLNLAGDREQRLQNRIYTLEKQLLDMAVSAATGRATLSAIRVTAAGSVTLWDGQERLPSMREEGEGEEENKEDRGKHWQPNVGNARKGGQESVERGSEIPTQGEGPKETKQNSKEARLQDFILSLQEDLRVLLEREEVGMTEQRRLMEQLQDAQEKSQYFGCKVEEMEAQVNRLKLSESSLMEEVEELKEENHRLQLIVGDGTRQSHSQSGSKSTFMGPTTNLTSSKPIVCPMSSSDSGHSSWWNKGEVSFYKYFFQFKLKFD